MSVKPGIGIFEARWSLQSHTVNAAVALAQAGYRVELFLHNTTDFYDIDQLGPIPNLQFHLFSELDKGLSSIWSRRSGDEPALVQTFSRLLGLPKKLRAALASLYYQYLLWRKSERKLLPLAVLQETRRLMHGRRYRCLIGVEKRGLVWAGRMANEFGIPYLYYSLELHTWDHPYIMASAPARYLKLAEEKYHRKSCATIVQDPRRAQVLLKDNGVPSTKLLYVPISLPGQPYQVRSSFLQKRLQLQEDQTLILQFGMISEKRWSTELARLAQGFPPNWVLVFHGYGPEEELQKIRAIDMHHKVILSLERLPSAQIPELITSAHVGLVLYRAFPSNDYLTAFSSEKLALYLQCGLPVIAFKYPGYELLEQQGCGVLIETLQDLPRAVDQILASYDEFSANARRCFLEYYEFSKNFQEVIDYIDSLP